MNRLDLFEKYASIDERLKEENQDVIYKALHDWAKEKTLEELIELGNKFGFASDKVMSSKDQYEDEHWKERKSIWVYDDPIFGSLAEVAPVPKLSESPGRIKWTARPTGIDNEHVFIRILGLSKEELEELYKKNVIGRWIEQIPWTCPPPDWNGKDGLFYP